MQERNDPKTGAIFGISMPKACYSNFLIGNLLLEFEFEK